MRILNSLIAIGSILLIKECYGYDGNRQENVIENGIDAEIVGTERLMNVQDGNENATMVSPSMSPTDTMAPFAVASAGPTTEMSSKPSAHPSSEISSEPSVSASYYPSSPPSVSPTMRSVSPTLKCNDLESYKSPINKFITCRVHLNTDCSKWKHLGLSDDEVLELYRSCPVSCGVDCGHSFEPSPSPTILPSASPSDSYALITADIEFYLMKYSTELSDDEVEELEEITLPFLRNHVNTKLVHLKSFEVASQDGVLENRRKLGRLSNTNDSMLKLTMKATGQLLSSSNPISGIDLKNSIVKAMETDAFSKHLNQSQYFKQTVVSFNNMSAIEEPEEAKPDRQNRKINGPKVTIVASLVSLSIVVVAIGLLYRHDRLPRLRYSSNREGKDNMLGGPFDEDSYAESKSSKVPDKIDGVCISRILSKNSSDESTLGLNRKYRGDPKGVEFSVVDRKPVENEDEDEENPHSFFANSPQPARMLIPPMIVIDNIDNEEITLGKQGATDADDTDNIFVRRIQATSDLVAALSAKKTPNPLQAYNFFNPLQSGEKMKISEDVSPHTAVSSRLSIGDTASLSTPCTIKINGDNNENNCQSLRKNNVFTFDSESKMEPRDDFTILFERKMKKEEEKSKLTLRGLFKRKKNSSFSDDSSPSEASHYESEGEISEVSAVLRERDRLEETNQASHLEDAGAIKGGVLDYDDEDSGSGSIDHDPDDMLADLPVKDKDVAESKGYQHCRNTSGASFTFSHKRNISEFSLQAGYKYSFLAPATGKLGIVIQSKGGSFAPTVFQVKDYSPLFGQLQPGDKIISVDGMDTSQMITSEITKLLAATRSRTTDKSRRVKVTIMSKYKKEGFQPEEECPVPQQIEMSTIFDDVRDDLEGSQNNEKDQQDVSQNMYLSDDDQSCHLIGIVNTDDWDEVDESEAYGGYNDQCV